LTEIFLLAVGAMFWPLLLLVDILAFQADRPVTILTWFLAGGFLTTVSIGAVLVYALRSTSLVTSSRHSTDSWVDITIGALCILASVVLWDRRERASAESSDAKGSERLRRLLSRGAPLAFVAGIVVNVFPGLLPFVALKDIAALDYSATGTLAVIVGFYAVMFTFVEAPLLGYVFAPRRTETAVTTFNAWLVRNWRALAASALFVAGVAVIVRGAVA
jgi:hypothetical protein